MSRGERSDIPNWVFTAGEKVQSVGKRIPLDWLIKPFVGSCSPAYVQAEWHRVDQVIDAETDDPVTLPIAYGDPEASLLAIISRFKGSAAVLGSHIYQLDMLLEVHQALPAVAFTYRDQTRVGTLPHDVLDLAMPIDSMHYLAAIRMGRNDVPAGIGAWLPSERVLLKPRDAIIKAQNVSIEELPQRFPGTPLV